MSTILKLKNNRCIHGAKRILQLTNIALPRTLPSYAYSAIAITLTVPTPPATSEARDAAELSPARLRGIVRAKARSLAIDRTWYHKSQCRSLRHSHALPEHASCVELPPLHLRHCYHHHHLPAADDAAPPQTHSRPSGPCARWPWHSIDGGRSAVRHR